MKAAVSETACWNVDRRRRAWRGSVPAPVRRPTLVAAHEV